MATKQFRIKIIFVENKTTPMKKHIYIFVILSVSLLKFNAFAQQGIHETKEISAYDVLTPSTHYRLFYDTLKPGSLDSIGFGLCGDTTIINKLSAPAQGYIGGNNSNGDLEVMQKFGVSVSGGLYTIMAKIGRKANTTGAGIIAKMYSIDPVTHGPDSLMAYTDPVLLADIDTVFSHDWFTTFPFAGVIYTTDSFFASIELPSQNGDTIAIYMTQANCFGGNQQAYVKKANGTFMPLNNGGTGSYNLNSDFMIYAVFIPDSSVGNGSITMNDLSLFKAYPNPTTNSVNLNFSILNSTNATVDFVNELGQTTKTIDIGFLSSGIHSINVDVSNLPSGYYYYSVSTEETRLFSRICVMH